MSATDSPSNGKSDEMNDKNQSHDGLSDEEVARALADLEGDFSSQQAADFDALAANDADDASHVDGDTDSSDAVAHDESFDIEQGVFDDELDELTGQKAREAIILTPFIRADILAAYCSTLSIPAWCVGSANGAFAVLRNLDGSAPEDAAAALSKSAPVVLLVNRGNKLNAQMWQNAQAGESIAPPLIFASADPLVEDLMIGVASNDELASLKGTVDSSSLTPAQCRKLLRSLLRDYFHRRHRRKGSDSDE